MRASSSRQKGQTNTGGAARGAVRAPIVAGGLRASRVCGRVSR
jgi:hypothetical protein